jgi:hypothetical protein
MDTGHVPIEASPWNGQLNGDTQPPLLALATAFVHEAGGVNATSLAWAVPRLERYIEWDLANRDLDGDGLLEWHQGTESGLDNSILFDDARKKLASTDFSAYVALEMEYIASFHSVLGNATAAAAWEGRAARTRAAIHSQLWDGSRNWYGYRELAGVHQAAVRANGSASSLGAFDTAMTPSGFTPLLLDGVSDDRVSHLVAHINDPAKFAAPAGLPTVALDNPKWCTNMWRGPAWTNTNFFAILGLRRYAHVDGALAAATKLQTMSIDVVGSGFREFGVTFEFYDSKNVTSPTRLARKTSPNSGGIRDYHWTAALSFWMLHNPDGKLPVVVPYQQEARQNQADREQQQQQHPAVPLQQQHVSEQHEPRTRPAERHVGQHVGQHIPGTLPVNGCTSDVDCSLNGVCSTATGACACDRPWSGPRCGTLAYAATTPAAARDLFPINRTHNTWNGPVVGPDRSGQFHFYVPLYGNYTGIKSLFRVDTMLHGVADVITGPYVWERSASLPRGINPAALAFPAADGSGRTMYTLWEGGILPSWSPAGPWNASIGSTCGGNSAPAYHNGSFYCVSQHTLQLVSRPALGGAGGWETVSDINITDSSGASVRYADAVANVEDPFLWVDSRGSFHIINHRFVQTESTDCGRSTISSHVFSADGKRWHVWAGVEPYGHTVAYDDGSSVTFPTLERPNLHFDSTGRMTHANFAAQISGGVAGCNTADSGTSQGRGAGAAAGVGKVKSCAECKFYRHCGTVMVALDV